MMDPGGETLANLKNWFEAAEESTRQNAHKMERDQDYYDGKQLTQAEYDALKARGQPPIAINLIRRKIDFMMGLEAQQRSDPKAFPRTPIDAPSAEVCTDALRYVADWNDYHQTRKRAWRDIIVTGVGGVQVSMRENRRPLKQQLVQMGFQANNPDVVITRTPWDRMWWDAHSSEPDFADCMHRGIVVWKDAQEVIQQYAGLNPNVQSIVSATIDKASRTDKFDDKPRYRAWADSNRQRVRVVQCWWRDRDQVHWCEYTEQGILVGGASPWFDQDEDQIDPFVWRSAYVDRDNNRHGVVRDMIDPQDEVNKRRSKALHLLTMRQVLAEAGAFDDVERAKRQFARPDGFIEHNPGMEVEVLQNTDLSSGQMQLLQHATMELEKMGPNAALQGTDQGDQSGRAIQAQQQGGMVELGALMDTLRSMDRQCFEKAWSHIKRYWSAPQFIRVTDREDAPSFVGLNEPMLDPATGMQVGQQNTVAELDMDIVIEQGPDVAVIEQEVWQDLTQALPTIAQLPPPWQMVMIDAMPYPPSKKKQLKETLQGGQQQDPRAVAMQQAQQDLQLRGAEAEVAEREGSARLKNAQAAKAARDAGEPYPAPQVPANVA